MTNEYPYFTCEDLCYDPDDDEGATYTVPKTHSFATTDTAIRATTVNWVTDTRGTRGELQAGNVFQVQYASSVWSPTSFSLKMNKAFWRDRVLVFDGNDLTHPVDESYHVPGTPLPWSNLVNARYETGTRSSVGATDLGTTRILLVAENADESHREEQELTLTVMRNVELTGYFTPHERNDFYIGDPPNYAGYDPVPTAVWNGTANQTIYVDQSWRNDVQEEGFGRLFRIRAQAQPCDPGAQHAATGNQSYLRWNNEYNNHQGRWEFSATARCANNTIPDRNSTARNANPNTLSYFNFLANDQDTDGRYDIFDLQQHTQAFINVQTYEHEGLAALDRRHIDDVGGGTVPLPGGGSRNPYPHWLDIYFVESDLTYGVDPEFITAFGRRNFWDEIDPNADHVRIPAYAGGQ